MLGLIVLLIVLGSLADLARRQERRTSDLGAPGPDGTRTAPPV